MVASIHIVPFAAFNGMQDFLQATHATLELPGLRSLLTRHTLTPTHWLHVPEGSFVTPHEQALVQAVWPALAQQAASTEQEAPPVSLAAWTAAQHGHNIHSQDGWALMAPAHLHITTDSISLLDPSGLALSAQDNAALLQAVQALWAEDGLTLQALPNGHWLAKAPWLHGLALPSLDRAINRDVRAWMPELRQTKTLQRLQTEAQMLLYNHAANDARTAQGLAPINALWVWGTGSIPASPMQTTLQIEVHDTLRTAALRGDYRGWTAAWQTLDQVLLDSVQNAQQNTDSVQWILAGEQQAVTLSPHTPSWFTRLTQGWTSWRKSDPVQALLQQL
ncbi:hypothetical protein E9531_10000 [Lampropedia puyangensis]|uniref:Phosphoglycerate mutase n=2 Tax=Lampropedia puyangensis TaxID=1330072 RepID=A0A4S8F108_9BURK|nr:hypothetical protein E9531_10000 [Lampropedia puyangensis]